MKKLIYSLLFAVAASTGSIFAEKIQIGDLYYNLDEANQTAEVTSNPNWAGYSGDIVIPDSVTYNAVTYCVTSIAEWAFENCVNMTSITISNTITRIGDKAFAFCSGLSSIIVGTNNIMYDSRENCNAIIETANDKLVLGCKNSVIPNSVINIGDWAFEYCSGLTSITIPNSVLYIGFRAFASCRGLSSITIPNSVLFIGYSAFAYCSGLSSVIIPSSVISIGNSAFENCGNLSSIIVEQGNIIYDSRDNCNAVIETETNTLVLACKTTVIPNSVTAIGYGAFQGCANLNSITIPNSITRIGEYAFYGCEGLTSISLPNSVKSIESGAFSSCLNLASVTIPNSVTDIGEWAFAYCSSLASIYNYATTPQTIVDEVFGNPSYAPCVDKSICKLYVPTESVAAYQNADVWKEFTNIIGVVAPQGISDPSAKYDESRKLLRDGQVLILRGDKTYTVTGQEIK